MAPKREIGLALARDPFKLMRQMTSEFDRLFEESPWLPRRRPAVRAESTLDLTWFPEIDVFEKDGRLITKIDLPGLKKDDVKVEVTDGQLTISGERKTEAEEKKENFYRCEREYGSFYRAVSLPEGVTLDDVKATFTDGVLEVSIPVPARIEAKPKTIEIQEAPKAVKPAA